MWGTTIWRTTMWKTTSHNINHWCLRSRVRWFNIKWEKTFLDAQICWLVTKTNSWVHMGNLEVASYTRQEHHLGDRIFSTRQKSVFFLFSSFSVQMKVRNMIKPSSVTKKNIMDGMDKAFGIVNTPHQWRYCDRICSLGSGIYFIDNLNTVDLRLD